MAAELLLELERRNRLPERYSILEVSADLQQRQFETLQRLAPHLLPRVDWLSTLPQTGFRGVVLANEVLDTLPVHRFSVRGDALVECYVTWKNSRFDWRELPLANPAIAQRLEANAGSLPDGFTSEVNLAADAWIAALADCLQSGVVLLIDYGFPSREYYHPQRNQGTLMCHYRHRSHSDPFVYPGLQDITAHVDFTSIAEAAYHCGLAVAGYTTQAYFLLANGIQDMINEVEPGGTQYLRLSQQIKTLTLPSEMGELFKVLALTKAYDYPLQGFQYRDLRGKL
jgi:SAM-dependent MidA family methyltransferase